MQEIDLGLLDSSLQQVMDAMNLQAVRLLSTSDVSMIDVQPSLDL